MLNKTQNNATELCKCCMGNGYQTNLQTGIREICKCCGGRGWKNTNNEPIYMR